MKTSIYHRYRTAFVEAIAARLGVSAQDLSGQVKEAEPAHGDLSFPTFLLAKSQKKAPAAIASARASGLPVPGLQSQGQGPYLNARFLPMPFFQEVLDQARALGAAFGSGDSQRGKTVVIDYSSPNIAKPIAFHHIRSTVIGHCLSNLYASQGARVEGINYLGDWGKQFGLVAVGFSEYADPARKHHMAHLVDVYVKANPPAERTPTFDEQARPFFRRMEQKRAEAPRLWQER